MGSPRIDRLDRNYLINGGFDFFQRYQSAITTDSLTAYYSPDRWKNTTFNQAFTVGLTTDTPLSSVSKYCLRYFTVSPISSSAVSIRTEQRIESNFAAELSNKTISLSYWYKSQSANQARVVLGTPDGVDDYATVNEVYNQIYDIQNDGQWYQLKIENIPLGDCTNGLYVQIWFQNTVLLVGNINHQISDVKLNLGEFAQEFSRAGRNYQEELSLCQRYFEKSYNADVPLRTLTANGAYGKRSPVLTGTSLIGNSIYFLQEKRVIPVVASYNPATGNRNVMNVDNVERGFGADSVGTRGFSPLLLTGNPSSNANCQFHWEADAEL